MQGSDPHIGAIVWVRGETFKAESETADLWQPKWNENQTVLAAAICTLDRDTGPLENTVAGSWSLGLWNNSRARGFVDCGEMDRGALREETGGKCLWRKARQPWKQGDIAESWVGGGVIAMTSLSPRASIGSWTIERLAHQVPDTLNYRVGPHPGWPSKWPMWQSIGRSPARWAHLCAWHAKQQRRTPGKGAL